MAVRPDRQNRGIGSRLIADGHRRLDESRESLILVVGHPAYYPRFGYRRDPAGAFVSPYQGDAMMAYAFRPAPTRGTLRYAAAFARLG
jgi:putative acetyltransferase